MYTLVLNEKGECEVVWCTANETFYLDNKTTSPYAVHCLQNIAVVLEPLKEKFLFFHLPFSF